MRPLRYSVNVTLDGCCDHRAIPADAELHDHANAALERVDALIFGRVTYQMMEEAFRFPHGVAADPADPFARTMDAARKYVVSGTLKQVDWNAQLLAGDIEEAVRKLKREPGKGLMVGGVQLALRLARAGLIDEYELVVHPGIAGHGPYLLAGLGQYVELKLVDRQALKSGAVAMRYVPKA